MGAAVESIKGSGNRLKRQLSRKLHANKKLTAFSRDRLGGVDPLA